MKHVEEDQLFEEEEIFEGLFNHEFEGEDYENENYETDFLQEMDTTEMQPEGEISRKGPAYTSWIQKSLNQILNLRLPVNGVLDASTRSAVRSFQQQRGLRKDGIVGPQTERAMIAAGATDPSSVTTQPKPALATPSAFAKKLATIAQEQHAKFQFMNEADPFLCDQIKKWTTEIGFAFKSCTKVPWSAVFVSWCVKAAGATKSEFRFSTAHSVFVHRAINDALTGQGVFHGVKIESYRPNVGDIIHHNRGGNQFDFAYARTHATYSSHSMIVTEIGQDTRGLFAFCIGGNESDSVRRSVVRLNPQGFIKQRNHNPFICIIRTLK